MTRWLLAAVVWAGAVAAAVGLGAVAHNHADAGRTTTTAAATATSVPATTPAATPPPIGDVTQSLPPAPSATASPHGSLFDAPNLEIVLARMKRRFGGDADVVQFGLYPGEADVVVVHNGGTAEVVRAQLDQPLDISPKSSFSDDVQAINLTQIQPEKVAAIIAKVRRAGDLPFDGIARVVLQVDAYPGNRAGYRVYPTTGGRVYRTLLTGGELETTSG